MKKVKLNIRSLKDGIETSNLYTVASMRKRNGGYDFVFDSPDEKTFSAKRLRLSVSDLGLSICADGTSKLADFVLEKGKKHYCYFPGKAAFENFEIGIDTYSVQSTLTDDGGSVEVSYYMDRNCSSASKNIMQINVKPNV
jgi:hypothetical protein